MGGPGAAGAHGRAPALYPERQSRDGTRSNNGRTAVRPMGVKVRSAPGFTSPERGLGAGSASGIMSDLTHARRGGAPHGDDT